MSSNGDRPSTSGGEAGYTTRHCRDCHRALDISQFYWVSKASGKLRGQCKDCMRAQKRDQRDPGWTPACSRCGERLPVRTGSGRRLCDPCFATTYDLEHRRAGGSHRIKLQPCSLCGGEKERFERGKLCHACKPWERYAKSLRRFGLTPTEYVAIFTAQGGVCYVCGAPPEDAKRLCIDHDHSMPEGRESVRGLLCDPCNYSRLPRFADDVAMLMRTIEYLTNPPAQGRSGQQVGTTTALNVPLTQLTCSDFATQIPGESTNTAGLPGTCSGRDWSGWRRVRGRRPECTPSRVDPGLSPIA
jgi:hypothetical protein